MNGIRAHGVSLEQRLREVAAAVMDLDPSELETHRPLVEMGLDSMLAAEIRARAASELGLELSVAALLQGSISSLSKGASGADTAAPAAAERGVSPGSPGASYSYPLSEGQAGLWIVDRLSAPNGAYNCAYAVRIRSSLDEAKLRRCFQRILDRHEVLRAVFGLSDGRPSQTVRGHATLDFEVMDQSSSAPGSLSALAADEARRPFDLKNGPVFRVRLLSRAPDDAILLISAHHIAWDFHSFKLVMNEFFSLYSANDSEFDAALPAVTRAYQDYVRWQERLLQGRGGEKLWRFWESRLAGSQDLALPLDFPRAAVEGHAGASVRFSLGEETVKKMRAAAQKEGKTLYMFLAAVLMVLLGRYSNQDDVAIGSSVSCRPHEFNQVVGYFVNLIVLRVDLKGAASFDELLGRVGRTVLDAIAHQDYPFPLLVQRLDRPRDPSRSPLVQVLFNLRDLSHDEALAGLRAGGGGMTRAGLALEPVGLQNSEGIYDLYLSMEENLGRIEGAFQYRTDLFTSRTIERMAAEFQAVLDRAAGNPSAGLEDLFRATS